LGPRLAGRVNAENVWVKSHVPCETARRATLFAPFSPRCEVARRVAAHPLVSEAPSHVSQSKRPKSRWAATRYQTATSNQRTLAGARPAGYPPWCGAPSAELRLPARRGRRRIPAQTRKRICPGSSRATSYSPNPRSGVALLAASGRGDGEVSTNSAELPDPRSLGRLAGPLFVPPHFCSGPAASGSSSPAAGCPGGDKGAVGSVDGDDRSPSRGTSAPAGVPSAKGICPLGR
jgi:hypothetical protein